MKRAFLSLSISSLLLVVLLCSCNSVLKKECENCGGNGYTMEECDGEGKVSVLQ